MRSYFSFLTIIVLSYVGVALLKPPPIPRHFSAEFAPAKGSENFLLGYRQIAADLMWLNVIQHMDVCHVHESESKSRSIGSPIPVEKSRNPLALLLNSERPVSLCHLGWVYQMLDRITDTDPRFQIAYSAGATDLSILVGDREGASLLFAKGLEEFPEDGDLAFKAAYHALYEMGDAERTAKLLIQAGRHGAPDWVFSLARHIYTEQGQLDLGHSVLESTIAQTPPGPIQDRLRERLAEIDSAIREQNRKPSSHP